MKKYLPLLGALLLIGLITGASAQTTDTTNVTVTIQNEAPTILAVQDPGAQNPTQNTVTAVTCNFTASDDNGHTDLNTTSAGCDFISGATTLSSSGVCGKTIIDSTNAYYECNVNMNYYSPPGTYTINATIYDLEGTLAFNDTITFTYNSLTAMDMTPNSVSFGTLSVGQSSGATDDPLVVYNQGNVALSAIGVKAYDLGGAGDSIPASAFNVSTTDSQPGDSMVNDTGVNITGASVSVGSGSSEDIYVYLLVPTVAEGTYESVADWVVSVFT